MTREELYAKLDNFSKQFNEIADKIVFGEIKGKFVLYNNFVINVDKDNFKKSPNPYFDYMLKDKIFPANYWYYNKFGNSNYSPIINIEGKVILTGLKERYDKYAIKEFIQTKI